MKLRWTPDRIAKEAVRLNGMVDGGFVTITAHPIFGYGRWVVRVEIIGGEQLTIGTDPNLDLALDHARKWIEKNRPPVCVREDVLRRLKVAK